MDEDVLRQRPGLRHAADWLKVGFAASKLSRPMVRPGSVRRLALIDRLSKGGSFPIMSVVAPAGYGKTTLLSQWAERNGQAFAWVSLDERDNDPKVLLSYVAEALNAVEPIDERVFDALASPGSSVPGSVVPRLGSALASMTAPVVLVLDDVHVLHNRECRAAMPVLAGHVPAGSQLVLSGRDAPPLPIALLRADGEVMEIGPGDLALTVAEASSLLQAVGITLGQDDLAELHRRTEGWPAGLYLAALSLREGGSVPNPVASFTGEHHLVSRYMQSEFLARIPARRRKFLTRTAVLERMCGPLCEAVLDQPGAAAALADLARSNLLLAPLDSQGEWYRYHQLFRDMLLAELRRLEPELIPVLRRRAAAWCLQDGLPGEALEHYIAADDVDAAARLVGGLAVPAYRQGRVTTLLRWFRWLDERGGIEGHPMVAVLASLLSALTAQPVDAERWADAVDRWRCADAARPADPPAEAWAAVLRAFLCRRGVEQMRDDADEAARKCAELNIVTPIAVLLQGIARVLSGDPDGGDAAFQEVLSMGEEDGAAEDFAVALCERSLLAMARSDWSRAKVLADQARAVLHRARREESFLTPLVCAVQARTALHRGDISAARQELISAQRMRHELTYALPHWAVQARIELARACIALTDLAGARTLTREIDELLRHRPDLGTLVSEAEALRAQLSKLRGPEAPGASALTAAELRLLPMLATHLSFPQIAEQMSLSRHTVKAEATSIYRKLGASSRNQAVMRARNLGLLDE
jgi:LuxR family transcriptional regulator, maltose regulon positive regulatory protein